MKWSNYGPHYKVLCVDWWSQPVWTRREIHLEQANCLTLILALHWTTYRGATNCSKSITWSRFLFFSCCCDFFRCLRKSKTLEEASWRLNHMNNFGKKLADEQYQHRKIIATVVYNSLRNSNVDCKSRGMIHVWNSLLKKACKPNLD